jgi:N-formylglutamate amidohydrolase
MLYQVPGVYDLTLPDSGEVPLVLDSPHSGHEYPDDFQCLVPQADLRRVEDSFVDDLFADAAQSGATLLCARFPRSYIDPNRAVTDIDPALLMGSWPDPLRPTEKSRLGHGLVWKTYPPNRPLYAGKLPVAAVQRRIEQYWRPYHETLETEIRRLHAAHGCVYHLNCHSMPSTSSPFMAGGGRFGGRADFVLGDRDGTSCDAAYTHFVRDHLQRQGYTVRLNDPYRGAELVQAYAAPDQGRHSLQIEINRAIYMNEATLQPDRGYTTLRKTLTQLVAALSGFAKERRNAIRAEAAE